MKRIFFVCVEGFAKAKGDGDGFYLRLKTYFASSFWNADETGPQGGALMKRIFFVCVDGFAKAKMDGDRFSLRLKTATENLFCFKLLERG